MKVCNKCKVSKSFDEFAKDKSKSDGVQYTCRVCDSIRAKAYRAANKVKVAVSKSKYWEDHKDTLKVKNKQYYEANAEKLSAGRKALYYKKKANI